MLKRHMSTLRPGGGLTGEDDDGNEPQKDTDTADDTLLVVELGQCSVLEVSGFPGRAVSVTRYRLWVDALSAIV